MTGIEKMRRYIDRTAVEYPLGTPYQLRLNEVFALSRLANSCSVDAICFAFEYGRAKGERHASKRMVG